MKYYYLIGIKVIVFCHYLLPLNHAQSDLGGFKDLFIKLVLHMHLRKTMYDLAKVLFV